MPTASEAPRSLAVLGSPIAHSKSPALHAAAYRVLGLPWEYGMDEVVPDKLAGYVASRPAGWRGLSLTMPLKQSVLPLVGSLDETARLTGAANTILFDDAGAAGAGAGADAGGPSGGRVLRGFNTDVPGIVRALAAAGVSRARDVLILGGGATAASALVAAAELGAELAVVQVREPARAEQLRTLAASVGIRIEIGLLGEDLRIRPDLVVSTLPGTAGSGGNAERLLGPASRAADPGTLLLDVAYDPWPTELVSGWDGPSLSGLAMLVHQALLQVRIFVSGDPERELRGEDAVLAAMLDAVGLDATGRPSAR